MRTSVILFFLLNLPSMLSAQNLSWEFIHPVSKKIIAVCEKGTVQEKLIEIRELPDPFYGKNEDKFTWIEHYKWEFYSSFEIDEIAINSPNIELEFPSLDTYVSIFINDSLVSKTENAFHPYFFQIKKFLKVGKNTVKLVFTPPILFHQNDFKKLKTKLPSPNDVGEIAVASMTRKPQYQFGWDWALRMNTIGLWKPATLHFYPNNRLKIAKIETLSCNSTSANLKMSLYFVKNKKENVKVKSKIFGEFSTHIDEGKIDLGVKLDSPKLWWPRGHGEAFLYSDTIEVYDAKGVLMDSLVVVFGVKTVELIQENDQWGTSFYFKINDKTIFCKGANYIPQDVFPSRVTEKSISTLVEQAFESNFNMIRVWGGGYYPDEIFYKKCNELGIMVWQDLMFACAMYPGDLKFLKNVEEELDYQIPRISAHPSVVYFNGNNEVDVAWKNWGFQVTYLIGPKRQRQMELDYKNLFKELAPKVIAKHSNLPYVHTSPLSNWGKEEGFNSGTMHYWGVWHGKDPLEDFGLKAGRFNAEYGFQSFPEYSTLNSFSKNTRGKTTDWDLNSDVMKHHQKSYVGNGMIKKHSDKLYGEAANFEEFVYFSQITQAKAVGIAIAGHRVESPRSAGTLYWQFNDSWPAPTWSSIDYFGNWKALQYQVKKDFEDVGVIERVQEIGKGRYFFISDLDENFVSNLSYKIKDLNGKLLFETFYSINVDGNWLQELCTECYTKDFENKNYLIEFEWTNNLGKIQNRTFFHEVLKFAKSEKKNIEISLENVDLVYKKATLTIKNKNFVADFWIYSNKMGVKFHENFLNLLPGEHKIDIYFEEIPELKDFNFIFR